METIRNKEASALKLKEWLDARGIKAVLFDLDDTLLDTYPMMQIYKKSYTKEVIKDLPTIDINEFWETLERLDIEVDNTVGVDKERWTALIDGLIGIYEQDVATTLRKHSKTLEKVHSTAPPLLPGALETL